MAMNRSRRRIVFVVFILINTKVFSQNVPDSLLNNSILNVELVKDSCGVGFFVKNELCDTLFLRSPFFIDDPVKLSHILIYYSLNDKNNTAVNYDYGYATTMSVFPVILEFFNRKAIIPPQKRIYFPLTIPNYSNSTVFLKLQLVLLQKDKLWYVQKTTNSIRF